MIRKATREDIPGVVRIYDAILEQEANGACTTGWIAGVYPTEQTALDALAQEELFVLDSGGAIVAAAKINQEQVPVYAEAAWEFPAPDEEVLVLHTLVVSPNAAGKGYGTQFVRFYEALAAQRGCPYLRMDTNARNLAARTLYRKLGYKEVGIVPCDFNGIPGVQLVCLEKKLQSESR